ncbi:MAG: hypothetical protein KAR32_13775, partial [Candidatus Omnitrophica bacterium]|nr:hypothetical protein [Candidatus Omnitrophota bacterium]
MNAGFVGKRAYFGFILIVSIGVIGVLCGNSYAQNSKKVGQHNFQLPDDWPVEKRGGLITPLPTEEYVSIKFEEIEKEFQAIKDDFTQEFDGFRLDLKGIEEDLAKE